jgi:hypothetical protein
LNEAGVIKLFLRGHVMFAAALRTTRVKTSSLLQAHVMTNIRTVIISSHLRLVMNNELQDSHLVMLLQFWVSLVSFRREVLVHLIWILLVPCQKDCFSVMIMSILFTVESIRGAVILSLLIL